MSRSLVELINEFVTEMLIRGVTVTQIGFSQKNDLDQITRSLELLWTTDVPPSGAIDLGTSAGKIRLEVR